MNIEEHIDGMLAFLLCQLGEGLADQLFLRAIDDGRPAEIPMVDTGTEQGSPLFAEAFPVARVEK